MTITTHATKAEALAHITAHAGPEAQHLNAMTRGMFDNPQHIVADPVSSTVWHATGKLGEEPWTVTTLTAAEAADRFRYMADGAQNILDEVDSDAMSVRDAEGARDEYHALMMMTLPWNPSDAVRTIKRRQRNALLEQARWARVYAAVVRGLVGNERGGRARAARQLGVSEVQIGRILAEDEERNGQNDEANRRWED